MLFDFERFKPRIKLAYRNCTNCPYSIEEVTEVIAYYFDTYEYIFDNPHPVISLQQLTDIIRKMPEVNGLYIEPENYPPMIDQHFATDYGGCDYNINHFFSGLIRENRFYEACYRGG